MHITRYTDYALRVMTYVALKGEGSCTIQEIADAYGISKNHLMKVVQQLNAAGYLNATRGKSGGLRLGRPAAEINLGQLVRDTEKDLALVECLGDADTCVITPGCKLKGVLQQALRAFWAVLDEYTLADLVTPRNARPLLKLLNL
ncbi:BadM/Rrf2 family transcriptional regulator [Alteromonadaceae bacterium 2753L.S.0a.02]|nr:BadM/Rrf2 family transcriptional regulator [Alteromonadaceae bacterium 2753L.S.0a.02]